MASPQTTPQTVADIPDRFSNNLPHNLPDPSQPIDVEFIEKPNPNLLPGEGQELLEDNPQNKYDPEAIAAHYQQRPFVVLGRFLKTLLPLVFFYINLWWDKVTNQRQQKERNRAIQLRKIVTNLGPAYIKVGQALSTRPDLLPVVFIEELSTLQDQLPPFPNSLAFQFIEEEALTNYHVPGVSGFGDIEFEARAKTIDAHLDTRLHIMARHRLEKYRIVIKTQNLNIEVGTEIGHTNYCAGIKRTVYSSH